MASPSGGPPPTTPPPASSVWGQGPPTKIQQQIDQNKVQSQQKEQQKQQQQQQQPRQNPNNNQSRNAHQQQGRGRHGSSGRGRGGRESSTGQPKQRFNHPARGRGGGRGPAPGRGRGPVAVAPTTGIPYGYVPAYLPGAASLVEELDERILLVLRDGRHLVGILRSFDQFSNFVLEDTFERRMHPHDDGKTYYTDVPLGIYVVRGDSLVLTGQVPKEDETKDGEDDGGDADDTKKQQQQQPRTQHPSMKRVTLSKFEELVKSCKVQQPKLEWDVDKDLLA